MERELEFICSWCMQFTNRARSAGPVKAQGHRSLSVRGGPAEATGKCNIGVFTSKLSRI